MEGSQEEWKKFIHKNGSPEWVNVNEDTNGKQPSDIYYADYTRKFLLLDEQGTIVHRMPRLEEVNEEIAKRLR